MKEVEVGLTNLSKTQCSFSFRSRRISADSADLGLNSANRLSLSQRAILELEDYLKNTFTNVKVDEDAEIVDEDEPPVLLSCSSCDRLVTKVCPFQTGLVKRYQLVLTTLCTIL